MGGFLVLAVVLIAIVPKPVWILLLILGGAALITWIILAIGEEDRKCRAEAEERDRADAYEQAAEAKRERRERDQRARQEHIATLGKKNAEVVESAVVAARQVGDSEAAHAGWLGDVDFTTDIQTITGSLKKAYDLRLAADRLAGLESPNDDDRRILAEAKATIRRLEDTANRRVVLIVKCADEAQHIDDSLRREREDAKVAAQRAELHAELSAMLYGVEATPDTSSTSPAVDSVMARVQAYREIKGEIDKARLDGAA